MLDPNGEYLTSAWQNHVYPLAWKLGVTMNRPPIQTRSRLAHEAAKWAESHGRLADYNLALFRAFFEFGRNIGDINVLVKIAAELQLDQKDLAEALASHRFVDTVLNDEGYARKLGVRAVPSFVANDRILASGVQTAARLKELLEKGPPLPLF